MTIDHNNYPSNQLPLQNITATTSNPLILNDLISLPYLNEPSILTNLSLRHKEEKPYTMCGEIVLAFNPYKRLPIYTEEVQSGEKRIILYPIQHTFFRF